MSKKKNISSTRTPSSKQMSRAAIQNYIRPHVPHLIARALELVDSADNDSVKLGAIKTLLAKVIPDLKASELTGKDGEDLAGLVIVKYGSDKPK